MQEIKLTAGAVPADRILRILEENGIRVNAYAEQYFSHPRFSAVLPENTAVTVASLQEIGLESGAVLDEIFQRLPQVGLSMMIAFSAYAESSGMICQPSVPRTQCFTGRFLPSCVSR